MSIHQSLEFVSAPDVQRGRACGLWGMLLLQARGWAGKPVVRGAQLLWLTTMLMSAPAVTEVAAVLSGVARAGRGQVRAESESFRRCA